jgi:dCMP deaminase
MGLAKYISEWSKDPSTKVGAVIVDDEKKIVGLGFNGFPIKTSDNEELYYDRDYKLSKIVHAEINAILNGVHYIHGHLVRVKDVQGQ